ncbi:MAG TPA: class I SAM-dependent methyltransferase [Smithella sp.]|jgi:SAM-dependent methyltransferase|nr:class I SAM-dependent methyltransferase [Smithella sp.]NMC96620.1 class I SAM-dependent methyltransferase [Deltaproteobacteria bacterium]HOS14180.1 class I SAM-dependent methyltransferase [Smithella sp.]HPK22691.1 class I SAM-dependent methyltransferase [Smithella sp.]HPL47701.1 class I SAM-dependent methyltransferase [Smithella sp.]
MNINNSNLHKEKIKYSLLLLSQRYNYNRWIYNNIQRFIGNNVLEVGAGIGNLTDFILSKNKLTLIDIHQPYVDYLKAKYSFCDSAAFTVLQTDIQNIQSSPVSGMTFDTVICLNILEHLENDRTAVENMSHLLQPKGKLIILVPALKTLYGSMDISFDHRRRYNKKDLRSLIQDQNLDVLKLYYMNFPGMIGWFVNGRVLKKQELPAGQTKLFDQLVPFFSFAENIVKPPLGQSLILIARKT